MAEGRRLRVKRPKLGLLAPQSTGTSAMKSCHITVSAPKAVLVNTYSAQQEEEESEDCFYKKQGPGHSVFHSDWLWCEAPARRRKLSSWLLFCTSSA